MLMPVRTRRSLLPTLLLVLLPACGGPAPPGEAGAFEARARFDAPAARQAVAVTDDHFYAIGNRRIAKYGRAGGAPVATWKAESPSLIHLNSGVVIDGELLCAHSNYPGVPMQSSIERFDPEGLIHPPADWTA